jgi:bacteriorhodopsin
VVQFAVLSGMAPLHALTAVIAAAFSCASTVAADHFNSHRRGFHPRLPFIGWTIMGVLFTLGAWFMLFFPGITAARTRRRSTQGLYTLGVLGLVIGWIAYPVVWFIGTGTNTINVNAQILAQGIIDVATQLGLVFFILFTHVHDPEDPVWSFPDWFVNARAGTGPDGRGAYSNVPAGDNGDTTA